MLLSSLALFALSFAAAFGVWEVQTSGLQARVLHGLAESATWKVGPGPSPSIRFPAAGPYDERLGYTRIAETVRRFEEAGYVVESQARFSPALARLTALGVSPAYPEKAQSGLKILDHRGWPIFDAIFPAHVFAEFDAIPPVVVATLLYIENRELLQPDSPWQNPAIEWNRLAGATLAYAMQPFNGSRSTPGASTLATQLEKLRHSAGGITHSPFEKLRQMASASIRAYRDDVHTIGARRQIVVDYLNSIALAAVPGHGEVIGLPSGLGLWYDVEVGEIVDLLTTVERGGNADELRERAVAYKQVLSLLLAIGRPSLYLVRDRDALAARTDAYLHLLAQEGIISYELRDAALAVDLEFRAGPRTDRAIARTARVTAAPVRRGLVKLLGAADYYDLDRYDAVVESALDLRAQRATERQLEELVTPGSAAQRSLGWQGLLEGGDPSKIVYSATVYERTRGVNKLRVHADTVKGPFDANDGAMLDLGSTAKLRTVATYLELVASLFDRVGGLGAEALADIPVDERDVLTQWALDFLGRYPRADLTDLLRAAMDRRYSASPDEKFFTGGGIHVFGNYDDADDERTMSVRTAFRRSVNLVFVRLMRDVVNHVIFSDADSSAVLADIEHDKRFYYLDRFADREGRIYLDRFYRRYAHLDFGAAVAEVFRGRRPTPRRMTMLVRGARPDLGLEAYRDIMRANQRRLAAWPLTDDLLSQLYAAYDPARYTLLDQAYLADIHPLELWLLSYLADKPSASRADVFGASREQRRLAYSWLFHTGRKDIQDRRILTEMEVDAFDVIHRHWKRTGYPFGRLVPSYATALGSSADRPTALAELMGIIAGGGIRQPTVRIASVHIGEGTPYETRIVVPRDAGERVLRSEVAGVLHQALVSVVDSGTGRRAHGTFMGDDGRPLAVGGKTGTGDHHYKILDPEGEVVHARAVSRAATFSFMIGGRFFGVVSAYVAGPDAAEHVFTSSLATHVFKLLGPALEPLVTSPPADEPDGEGGRLAANSS